jgi:GrpB-like predicted nucleotidyltransferase (UPF0157 family)
VPHVHLPPGLTPTQVTTFAPEDPDDVEYLGGAPASDAVHVVPYDPDWPAEGAALMDRIRGALPPSLVRGLQHIGSTSVPGLPAKDVIDLDLEVPDPSDEDVYVPALESVGFRLRLREPGWHQHRLFFESSGRRVNLHVFAAGSAEPVRHRLLRDHLRAHPEERTLYADAKRAAAASRDRQPVMDYNRTKEPVLLAIYARAFAEAGLL